MECPLWDSNPHCRDFKSPASAIGLKGLDSPGHGRYAPDYRASAFLQVADPVLSRSVKKMPQK